MSILCTYCMDLYGYICLYLHKKYIGKNMFIVYTYTYLDKFVFFTDCDKN